MSERSASLGFVTATRTVVSSSASSANACDDFELDGLTSPSAATLFRWNVAMAAVHGLLAVVALTVGNLDLRAPLFATDLRFEDDTAADEPRFVLLPTYVPAAGDGLPLTWLVALFSLLSCVFHLGNALVWRAFYERELRNCRAPTRWLEYTLSAPVMMVLLSYFAGVRDYLQLWAIVALTATTMTFGWLTERGARPVDAQTWRPASALERLVPHACGWLPQLAAWAVVLVNFYDQEYEAGRGPPWFVYVVVWSQASLFLSFAVVQLVQQACLPPAAYARGELAYQALSLASKAVLSLLLLTNVLVLGRVEDAF